MVRVLYFDLDFIYRMEGRGSAYRGRAALDNNFFDVIRDFVGGCKELENG